MLNMTPGAICWLCLLSNKQISWQIIMVGYYHFTLAIHPSVHHLTVCHISIHRLFVFSFQDGSLSKCQWIFTNPGHFMSFLQLYTAIQWWGIMVSCFYAPAIFNAGGVGGVHIISPLPVRMYVRPILYVIQLVSVWYLLKRLVYWIEILYTGI